MEVALQRMCGSLSPGVTQDNYGTFMHRGGQDRKLRGGLLLGNSQGPWGTKCPS